MGLKWFRRAELQPVWADERQMIVHYRKVWKDSPVLRRFYSDVWHWGMQELEARSPVVELGGGAGLIREVYPEVITSDILPFAWTNLVCDASALPLASDSVGGMICTGFFHHCVNPGRLFEEVQRVLRPGGRFIILDPWVTPLGRVIYHFGSEEGLDLDEAPFEEEERTNPRPLLEANIARATVIFKRNRATFEARFPRLKIVKIETANLFRHLAAGSCVQKSPFPPWCYPLASLADRLLHPIRSLTGMSARIVLEKS
ncbi:MAG: class I SAM-dependent methyltransferase [bacterium]|nr:class I SAM-dependent methyltransferase [bacterium]